MDASIFGKGDLKIAPVLSAITFAAFSFSYNLKLFRKA